VSAPTPADIAGSVARLRLESPGPHERPYHSFTRVASPVGWLGGFLVEVSRWLAEKGLPDDTSQNTRVDAGDATLLVLRQDRPRESAIRVVLRERNTAKGDWLTEIVGFDSERSGSWLSLKVTNSEGNWVAVPRIIRSATDSIQMIDGAMAMIPDAHMVAPAGVPTLVETLVSPRRRGPVFVAATDDGGDFDAFHKRVKRWSRDTTGLAHVAILQPSAVPLFNEAMGVQLESPVWAIRTYQPGLTLDDRSTRHMYLTRNRVEQASDGYIASLLGRFAREASERLAQPNNLADERHRFERLENRLLTDSLLAPPADARQPVEQPAAPKASAVQTAPAHDDVEIPEFAPELVPDIAIEPVAVDARALQAELDRIRSILHVPDLDDVTLEEVVSRLEATESLRSAAANVSRRLDQLQDRVERLEGERNDLRVQIDDALQEQAEAAEERDAVLRRARWLDQELAKASSERAYAPLPSDLEIDYPESFEALFDRSVELGTFGVTLTGVRDAAMELDVIDPLGKSARTAWNALLALGDYVRACDAGDHRGDVDSYLKTTPAGYATFEPGKHARTETEATMDAYGDERMLPVPVAVDESGFHVMTAHFRLGRIGMKSPRMYYLDDLNTSGLLVVGYIGTHMRNTQTN